MSRYTSKKQGSHKCLTKIKDFNSYKFQVTITVSSYNSLNDFGMSSRGYVIWIISLLLDNGQLLEYNFPVFLKISFLDVL